LGFSIYGTTPHSVVKMFCTRCTQQFHSWFARCKL